MDGARGTGGSYAERAVALIPAHVYILLVAPSMHFPTGNVCVSGGLGACGLTQLSKLNSSNLIPDASHVTALVDPNPPFATHSFKLCFFASVWVVHLLSL